MSSVTWRRLAGDTQVFALDFALLRDEDEPFDLDEAASWGMFRLWVDGVNLCAHDEEAERLEGVHWYLLPLLEWIAEVWNPLLHEERLPAPKAEDAPSSVLRMASTLRAREPDWGAAESLYEWRSRHSWRTAAEGGLFPDLWMRRWRDKLEVAVGKEAEPGQPDHLRFRISDVYRVDVAAAGEALYEGVLALAQELQRRRPTSDRLASLVRRISELSDGPRWYSNRLGWLSGASGASTDFIALMKQVEEVFAGEEQSSTLLEEAVGRVESHQVVIAKARVALLFGSSAPHVLESDVQALSAVVLASLKHQAEFSPPKLDWRGVAGSAGEQGSALGEDAYWLLAAGREDALGWVDILPILQALNIAVLTVPLSDPEVRAVSVLSNGRGACIAVNANYKHGQREPIVRFTLAHELAHLLLDAERGVDLAVASGPWAPQAIEQRANAFAAALLMPARLILEARQDAGGELSEHRTVLRLARRLKVSVASLADRLHNL